MRINLKTIDAADRIVSTHSFILTQYLHTLCEKQNVNYWKWTNSNLKYLPELTKWCYSQRHNHERHRCMQPQHLRLTFGSTNLNQIFQMTCIRLPSLDRPVEMWFAVQTLPMKHGNLCAIDDNWAALMCAVEFWLEMAAHLSRQLSTLIRNFRCFPNHKC